MTRGNAFTSETARAASARGRDGAREANTTHGGASRTEKHPLYGLWRGMKQRCHDPGHISYPRYGAIGVRVCERWAKSFAAFVDDLYRAIGPRPSPRHSLDRFPNREGDYEPGNVRWALPTEQGRNMVRNHLVTYEGRTQCLQDWSDEMNIETSLLRWRLKKWPVAEAFTRPVRGRR